MPYSLIALQQMNLVHRYGSLFWNTAVLTINSGSDEDNDNNKTTNYGKIATAIGNIQNRGTRVVLPNINKAKLSFQPDEEHNEIVFGLGGVQGVGEDIIKNIINNQPYVSLEDFIEKVDMSKKQVIQLIKSGAFDILENKSRVSIMKDFVTLFHKREKEPLEKVTITHIKKLRELKVLPEKFSHNLSLVNFTTHITNAKYKSTYTSSNKKRLWYEIKDSTAKTFFDNHLVYLLEEDVDYHYDIDSNVIFAGANIKKVIKGINEDFNKWIGSEVALKLYNENIYKINFDITWEKYCLGTISRWEMESLSYYYNAHELKHVNSKYDVKKFSELSDTPITVSTSENKKTGKKYEQYKLFKIAGTVLDKDKKKNTITMLSHEGTVVKIKLYSSNFMKYDKQISKKIDGKKKIVEKSWWSRGNKILITGFRRGDQFVPRVYKNGVYKNAILLVKSIDSEGKLLLKYGREKVEVNE